jgi:hypothetical protein
MYKMNKGIGQDKKEGGQRSTRDVDLEEEYKLPMAQPIMKSVAMLSLSGSLRSETLSHQKEPRCSAEFRKDRLASSNWNVQQAMELPFHLEPSSLTVECDAEEVARRIDSDLRTRSVAAVFDDVEAVANCYTSCNLHYRISLFKSECGGTIVEVQKRKGCPFEFAKQRAAIHNASLGSSPKDAPKPFGTFRSMPIPDSVRTQLPPPNDSIIEDSLLQHAGPYNSRHDKMMSLEDLITLTNPEKTSPITVSKAAKFILLGDDSSLRELLINDVKAWSSDAESKSIRKSALQILFNCVICLKDDTCLKKVIDSSPWFSCVLAPTLLEDIDACGCPHHTCLSFQIIALLAQHSKRIYVSVKEAEEKVNGALEWGEDYGSARHAKLLETTSAIRHLMGQ